MNQVEDTLAKRIKLEHEKEKIERAAFEKWYTTHSFDYVSAPLGSRDCTLQWYAWLARAEHREEVAIA